MKSLFHNLYQYKEGENRHQKENFITEILAHCLRNDDQFREKLLLMFVGKHSRGEFNCQTQFVDNDFGKPDIYLTINDDIALIIECKIDAKQESTQLARYAELLKKQRRKRLYLIFLTKRFEVTDFQDSVVEFKHFRWYHVFEALQECISEISIEFRKYLIEQKMSSLISFDPNDFSAIKNYNEVISKMNDFLVRIADMLKTYTRAKVCPNKKIEEGDYGVMSDVEEVTIWTGFFQYEDYDEIQIGVSLTGPCSSKKMKNASKNLALYNWKTYNETVDLQTSFICLGMSDFLVNGVFQTNLAYDFVDIQLGNLNGVLAS